MQKRAEILAVILIAIAGASAPLAAAARDDAKTDSTAQVDRGRYIAKIALCVACHSIGYEQSAGKLPEAQWMTGNSHGFSGPWGTTYPVNLRLYMQTLSAEDWLKAARSMSTRPPMPWFVLREMQEDDLLAIYAFVRSLGPAGSPAPAYQPPGEGTR